MYKVVPALHKQPCAIRPPSLVPLTEDTHHYFVLYKVYQDGSQPLHPFHRENLDKADVTKRESLLNSTTAPDEYHTMRGWTTCRLRIWNKYTDISEQEVDGFAYYLVARDYFKLPDHCGGDISRTS